MQDNPELYTNLGEVIELLTDYHANGAYEKLKENVTLLDKENYAVMIRTTNFESNDFINNLIYIDEHAYNFLKKSKVYPSDLVMNKIANPGTVYFMPEVHCPVSLGMNLFLIRIDAKKADPYFVYAYLRKNEQYVKSFASGSTTKTITKDDVRRLVIYSPPIKEQKKIAQILSTWDKAILVTEKLLANSQQQKKALMQQLLTGKMRLLDENGVPFNGKWHTSRLGDIGEIKSAGVDKTIVEGEKAVRLLNFTDVFKRNFIYSNELNHWVTAPSMKVTGCNVLKGDVFFTPSSETRNEIGMSAVVAEHIPDCCYSYHIVRFRIVDEWDLNFKAFAFSTSSFRKQVGLLADGSGQRYVVSQNGFRNIEVTYPDIAEQKAIGNVLRLAEDTIISIKRKIDTLKQEKKALMQQLLTGKRRVKVDVEETVSA
ncbi:restriction endonuclease subunit S [Citrobacter portucalensis]|uniref:restriction endonuclease subunit S n=1 Tax=Citrobacter portucalensis TaxID=1639133 RepID=UPI003BF60551